MDEKQAIANLKRGDLVGLEVLISLYYLHALRVAYYVVGDRDLAEDVVQNAFARIGETIRQFDARRAFKPWFLRCVVNDAIKISQRQKRFLPIESSAGESPLRLVDPAPLPEEQVENQEASEAVWQALKKLPPNQRAAIVLRYFLDMDEQEMARRLNSPVGTIKWWLYAARKRLAAMILLAFLIAAGLLVANPQGRALAQEVLRFFTRAQSNTLPLQPWQMTPLPTIVVTPTLDPAYIGDANQAIVDVEQQAGFDVLQPSWLPDVLSFSGASYDPEHGIARLFYKYWDTNGLVLREQPFQRTEDCQLCGMVGASAEVESVPIGEVTGEYAQGVWKLTASGPVWQSDPYMKTLRWQQNGIAFELLYMGRPDSVTQEDLIRIAGSLSRGN